MNNVYQLLKSAIERYIEETKLLIDQLTNQILLDEPVQSGRPLGEIFLHMIRSIEYYLQGVINDHWEPLTYNLKTYNSVEDIINLYDDVSQKAKDYLEKLPPTTLFDLYNDFNRPATKAEMLLEMLEHNIQHRGQILVYYRLLGVTPAKLPYIV
ncbi:MAG: DinB family protein [Promethearchaeota archaeon]